MKQKRSQSSAGAIAAVTPNAAPAPVVCPRDVTDPRILDQGRLFDETLRQTQPIATAGSRDAAQAAKEVGKGTARPRGVSPEKCKSQVTDSRELDSLFSGSGMQQRSGKAAEVVAASDYLDMHAGNDPGIVNRPQRLADNLEDIRISPDSGSCKDLLFSFRTKDGMVITKSNGQVKTGTGQYVSKKLVKMAETPGYGKVGYVDARYVNSDGTPRVAPDGFTKAQARRLQKAKVRLRGIKDLDARAENLVKNVDKYSDDGFHPVAREQLRQLRDDIARAYQPGKVATRLVGGVATAAATAALLTLVLQLATEGKVDLATVGESAKKGGVFGAGSVLADAGIYHAATRLGVTPEVAKSYAQNGVAAGFCLIAVGVDVLDEFKSVRDGEVTTANAVAGTAAKAALNMLPFVVAPLGIAGIPIVVGAQVGGRWIINRIREADRKLDQKSKQLDQASQLLDQKSIILDHADQRLDQNGKLLDQAGEKHAQAGRELIKQLHMQQERSDQLFVFARRARDETNALFEEIFPSKRNAQLSVIK